MQANFSYTDTVVLILYFLATMGFGFASLKKSSTVEGFTAAKRAMPGWLTGLSILGSFVSSISFLGYTGKAYAGNWNAYVWCFSMPVATFFAARYFVPFYRKIGSVSAYENLENRFGTWARLYADICYLLTQVARIASVSYLMALPMSALFNWNIYYIVLLTSIAVILYSFVGGIVAVIWTEAMQTVVLIIGAIACALILTCSVPDGFSGICKIAGENAKFSFGSFDILDFAQSTFFVVLINGIFINLQNFGIDQNYVQRYITAKSDKEAIKGLWINGLIYIPLSAIFFYIGTALFCYYASFPSRLPAEYAANHADYVFPYFMVSELPIGFKGLLIAAVFAAAMSTISGSLNSSATIILTDFFKRFCKKPINQMAVLKISTIIIGALGTLIALLLAYAKPANALDVWWTLSGIFSGGMLGLFLMTFSSKVSPKIAIFAVAVGIVSIALLTFCDGTILPISIPMHKFTIPAVGTCVILLTGFVATTAIGKRK